MRSLPLLAAACVIAAIAAPEAQAQSIVKFLRDKGYLG